MNPIRTILFAAVAVIGISGSARAEDHYFLMMFAAQAEPNVAQQSHSFALFAKVSGDQPQPKIETVPISWMPASLQIEPLKRDPVEGKNLTLAETLQWATQNNAKVSMWGPFPIKKGLFDMAVAQAEKLQKGRLGYVMIDGNQRGKTAYNCIHAVSDMDKTQPALNSGTARGDEATKSVLSFFDPYILPMKGSNRWLVDRLGISRDAVRFVNPDLVAPP